MAALDDLVSKAKELADTVGKATGELVDAVIRHFVA